MGKTKIWNGKVVSFELNGKRQLGQVCNVSLANNKILVNTGKETVNIPAKALV